MGTKDIYGYHQRLLRCHKWLCVLRDSNPPYSEPWMLLPYCLIKKGRANDLHFVI